MRRFLLIIAVVAATAGCWRLGFWQLSRLAEKRALNAELRAMLDAPPLAAGARVPLLEQARGRRVEFAGRFDSRFHVLLRGRSRDGAPGVELVTPWVVAGDSLAVLVERGWLATDDAVTVAAETIPEDSSRVVMGIVQVFLGGAPIPPMREMGSAARRVWSASRLDRDSMGARLPYGVAPYFLQALPAPGAPAIPVRGVPRPFDEAIHLGYAAQWFLIGVLIPAGAFLLARRRRDRIGPAASGSSPRHPEEVAR